MTLLGNRIFIGINVDVKLIILMGMLLWLPDVPIFIFFLKGPTGTFRHRSVSILPHFDFIFMGCSKKSVDS